MVCVHAASDEKVEFAADTLRLYDPIAINVLPFSPSWNSDNPIPDRT